MEKRIGRIWWALLAGVVALTLLFATGIAHAAVAPKHDTKSVSGQVNCAGNGTAVIMADVWGGVHLKLEVDGALVYDQAISGSDTSVREFDVPITATPGDSLKAYTSDNVGGAEYGAVTGPSADECRPVIDPKGSFDGPCGDPLYGIHVDNSGSNVPVTFKLKFTNPIHGVQNRAIVVAAGDSGWWKGPVRKDPTYPSYGRWHVKAGTTLALRYVAPDGTKGLIFKTATSRAHGAVCTLLEGWVGEQA